MFVGGDIVYIVCTWQEQQPLTCRMYIAYVFFGYIAPGRTYTVGNVCASVVRQCVRMSRAEVTLRFFVSQWTALKCSASASIT